MLGFALTAVWMTDIQRDEAIDFYLKTVKKEKEIEKKKNLVQILLSDTPTRKVNEKQLDFSTMDSSSTGCTCNLTQYESQDSHYNVYNSHVFTESHFQ